MVYKHTLFICIFSMIFISNTIHADFLNPISSFFGGKPYEEIIEKDYPLDMHGHVSLKNIHGSIVVKTGLDKKSVAIRAIKRASAQEHLDHMHIIEEEVKPDQLTLRTAYDYEKVKGTVDYLLTIPDDAAVHISCDIGDITINQVHGSIEATTGHGDITIEQPTNKVQATITQQGNITITQPREAVKAMTNKGIVHVRDSMNGVTAKAKQGKVEIKCKTLSAQKQLQCSVEQGPIVVQVPQNIQCSIAADAPKGTVTGDQPIRIKSAKTMLNNDYWNRVKKQVRGSIGKEEASVNLHAKQGNIKIMAIK